MSIMGHDEGIRLYKEGKYKESHENLEVCLKKAHECKKYHVEMQCQFYIGNICAEWKHSYRSALLYYHRAMAFYSAVDDQEMYKRVLSSAACSYKRLGMTSQALEAYKCKLQLLEESGGEHHVKTTKDELHSIIDALELKLSSNSAGSVDWDEGDGVLVGAESPLSWTEFPIESIGFVNINKRMTDGSNQVKYLSDGFKSLAAAETKHRSNLKKAMWYFKQCLKPESKQDTLNHSLKKLCKCIEIEMQASLNSPSAKMANDLLEFGAYQSNKVNVLVNESKAIIRSFEKEKELLRKSLLKLKKVSEDIEANKSKAKKKNSASNGTFSRSNTSNGTATDGATITTSATNKNNNNNDISEVDTINMHINSRASDDESLRENDDDDENDTNTGISALTPAAAIVVDGFLGKFSNLLSTGKPTGPTISDLEVAQHTVATHQQRLSKAHSDKYTRLPRLLESLQECDMERVEYIKAVLSGQSARLLENTAVFNNEVYQFADSVSYIDKSCDFRLFMHRSLISPILSGVTMNYPTVYNSLDACADIQFEMEGLMMDLFAPKVIVNPSTTTNNIYNNNNNDENNNNNEGAPNIDADSTVYSHSIDSTSKSTDDYNIDYLYGRSFQNKSYRSSFLQVLNAQRSKECNVAHSFDRFIYLVVAFLDASRFARDVISAKRIMILTETFYRDRAGVVGDHEFIQEHIKPHPIWNDCHFWEEAFLSGVRDELKKSLSYLYSAGTTSNSNSTVNNKGIIDANIASKLKEAYFIYDKTWMSQLGSYAFSMKSFGASLESTRHFIISLATCNNLSPKRFLSDLNFCETVKVAQESTTKEK